MCVAPARIANDAGLFVGLFCLSRATFFASERLISLFILDKRKERVRSDLISIFNNILYLFDRQMLIKVRIPF